MINVNLGANNNDLERSYSELEKTFKCYTACLLEAKDWKDKAEYLFKIREVSEAMELVADELTDR